MAALCLAGCAPPTDAPLGTAENPVKMAFVPSLETGQITTSAEALAEAMEEKSGLQIEVSVPTDYATVIEAMGAGRVDVAWFAPMSYVLAHDKYGAEVMLIAVREGKTDYVGVVLARTDGRIQKLEDFRGKRFAFTDPLSTSGTLYPKQLLAEHGVDPDTDLEALFAGGHDKAIIALANGQVDGCSCYGGEDSDARDRVVGTIPDIFETTKVIARTAPIPNDNVSASRDLPADIREKLRDALLEISASEEGRKMLLEIADIDGLEPVDDGVYDTVRRMVESIGIDLEEFVDQDKAAASSTPKKKPGT